MFAEVGLVRRRRRRIPRITGSARKEYLGEVADFSLAGKKKKKSLFKRAFSKKRLKAYAIGAGVIAAGYFAAPFVGPKLGAMGSGLMGFFRKSGMSETAAKVAADQVLAGKAPVPEGFLPEASRIQQGPTEAGMFPGGVLLPLVLLGGGVLAFTMLGGKGGPRRGRR